MLYFLIQVNDKPATLLDEGSCLSQTIFMKSEKSRLAEKKNAKIGIKYERRVSKLQKHVMNKQLMIALGIHLNTCRLKHHRMYISDLLFTYKNVT